MADIAFRQSTTTRDRDATRESSAVRAILIGAAVAVLALFLFLPLLVVFAEATSKGLQGYGAALRDPDTLHAIGLTLIVAAICVPINTLFGLAAAWAVARFDFKGKSVLVTLIDLPLSISPIVAGLVFILLFSTRGIFAPLLAHFDIQIVFALPGIVLATLFVTFSFVARELIPILQHQGSDDEQAALTLGASALKMFRTVTLPNVRWGLLYGVLLCNARAMGEFGAVSVISGRVRGQTNTMPLQIEALYNDYDMTGAFVVASLLAVLALLTLVVKTLLEWRFADDLASSRR